MSRLDHEGPSSSSPRNQEHIGIGLRDGPIYLDSWVQPDGDTGLNYYAVYNAAGVEPENYAKRTLRMADDFTGTIAQYTYIGRDMVIGTDTPETALKMTFMFTESGSANYSTYLDRFNRSILNRWRRDYSVVLPKIVELELAYDVAGNMTTLQDNLLLDANGNRAFDHLNTFNALRYQIERGEGELNTGSITGSDRKRREITARNLAGRITSNKIDLDWNDANTDFDNGPPAAPAAGEMDDNRAYNKRNQLTGRSYYDSSYPHSGSRNPVTLTYDANGNLTSDGETYDYVYNPFGQLVAIKLTGTGTYAAKYTYNGFGQRISEQTDTNNTSGITKSGTYYAANSGVTDGLTNSDDPVFFMAVDAQGRRVATFRNTDQYPKETFAYNQAGLSGLGDAVGPNFKGGLLLRDRNASLTDPTKWATETAGATRGERHYYLSDLRGNVSALIDSASKVTEQYRYSPSGMPFGIPGGNIAATGTVTGGTGGTDYGIVSYNIANSLYESRADLDLDGDVDSGDLALVVANNNKTAGRGYLTVADVGNRSGAGKAECFGQGFSIVASIANTVFHTGLSVSQTSESVSQPSASPGSFKELPIQSDAAHLSTAQLDVSSPAIGMPRLSGQNPGTLTAINIPMPGAEGDWDHLTDWSLHSCDMDSSNPGFWCCKYSRSAKRIFVRMRCRLFPPGCFPQACSESADQHTTCCGLITRSQSLPRTCTPPTVFVPTIGPTLVPGSCVNGPF